MPVPGVAAMDVDEEAVPSFPRLEICPKPSLKYRLALPVGWTGLEPYVGVHC